MKQYIGCDAHRRYSVFVSVDEQGIASPPSRGGTRSGRVLEISEDSSGTESCSGRGQRWLVLADE